MSITLSLKSNILFSHMYPLGEEEQHRRWWVGKESERGGTAKREMWMSARSNHQKPPFIFIFFESEAPRNPA